MGEGKGKEVRKVGYVLDVRNCCKGVKIVIKDKFVKIYIGWVLDRMGLGDLGSVYESF